MLATVRAATLRGVRGLPVAVEVHVGDGLPGFSIVGSPDTACREARDRVRAALVSSRLEWPNRRVTVNLAPGGVPKLGAGLDLAIAGGLLAATEQIPTESLRSVSLLGELGLDGSVRPVSGALPLVDAMDSDTVVVAPADLEVGRLVGGDRVESVGHLGQLVAVLKGERGWPEAPPTPAAEPAPPSPDLAEVKGHPVARYALEVAAAGGHHLLLVGPPGAGKTMLARRLPGLLPDLNDDEALDVTRVHSAAGLPLPGGGLVRRPPWRAPHHSASMAALVGGGSGGNLRPGELSNASGGVLFLDELGEFTPMVLDALRQPLEEGVVRVSRAGAAAEHPARVLLVAAMNPCPCGVGGLGCGCAPTARQRYGRRVSGPLLDRLDLVVAVDRPRADALLAAEASESTADVAERVARVRQLARSRGVRVNAELSIAELDEYAPLTDEARCCLRAALSEGRLSGRGLQRVRAVARTVNDLRHGPLAIRAQDVATAMTLRVRPAMAPGADR